MRQRRYKRLEKNIVSHILRVISCFFSSIGQFFAKIFRILDGKLTLMIVPHSNGKVFSVQTNVFAVIFGALVIVGILGSFVYFNQKTALSGIEISRLRDENRETLASLDELRDENNTLLQSARKFQSTLSQSLALLGINHNEGTSSGVGRNSDLSSMFDTQDMEAGHLRESSDIKELTAYLESAVVPVEQIGKMLENQGAFFSDIPNIWPVKGGIGHISMEFGQKIHPITQQWYIHKGLDISTYRQGDPVMATANGQVVAVNYDDSFGLNIIIRHKYGIYTRYAHLSSSRVRKGDTVSQRQVIGNIGNTGISTGPHLHYEVHIGSDVVDPAKYVNIK